MNWALVNQLDRLSVIAFHDVFKPPQVRDPPVVPFEVQDFVLFSYAIEVDVLKGMILYHPVEHWRHQQHEGARSDADSLGRRVDFQILRDSNDQISFAPITAKAIIAL